jgi:glycosyltransferase involved in cell wall biosynthesis
MASTTPVVAINAFGPKDIVKDGISGFLTKNDLDDFSAKIKLLLNNEKLRQKLGMAAVQNVKYFSIENRTNKLLQIYRQAIRDHVSVKKSSLFNKIVAYFK